MEGIRGGGDAVYYIFFSSQQEQCGLSLRWGSPMSLEGAVVHGVVLVVFTGCRRYGEAQAHVSVTVR